MKTMLLSTTLMVLLTTAGCSNTMEEVTTEFQNGEKENQRANENAEREIHSGLADWEESEGIEHQSKKKTRNTKEMDDTFIKNNIERSLSKKD